MNNITKRIIIIIVSLVSVFIFPWWFLLAVTILVSIFVPLYLEMIIIGYWLDTLYGLDGDNMMLITFLLSFLIVLYIKKNLLFK
jgi:hypothetical protein